MEGQEASDGEREEYLVKAWQQKTHALIVSRDAQWGIWASFPPSLILLSSCMSVCLTASWRERAEIGSLVLALASLIGESNS